MRRVDTPELLDAGAGTPAEIQASLRDLRRINRWFGGIRTARTLLQRVAEESGRSVISVLDVAAGSGDVLTEAARQLATKGIEIKPTLLDQSATHLAHAPDVPKQVGNALHLPFPDNSFDVVMCSLFLHHLNPAAAQQFAREAARVARLAFVVNDLRRSRLHLLLNYLGLPLFSRMTRFDSIASVRRAYTLDEARELLNVSGAGFTRIDSSRHYLYRMGFISWKTPPNPKPTT
jgi:ubiquinone/menaquinone biosynthesis C-methylase UbiE